tara:strand:+ start:4462 stop:5292 length:831 start_codon:yes stop_codon:yes gene_type:complete
MKLILENWRRFVEDQEKRQAFAKDLKSSGRSKANLVSDRGPKTKNFRDEIFKQVLSQGRDLKKAFAKTADRDFLDSLVTVHWTGKESVVDMLKGGLSSRDELSAAAYLPDAEVQGGEGAMGRFGIVIKGHITLLANDMDQLYTGSGEGTAEYDPQRTKMSGANKGAGQIYAPEDYAKHKIIVLDRDDWKPRKHYLGGLANEALVDNWNPVALIVPGGRDRRDEWEPEMGKMTPKPGPVGAGTEFPVDWVSELEALVKKSGLDIPVMGAGEFKRQWS